MLKSTKVIIILDRDVKDEVPDFMRKQRINFSVKLDYLPIKSIEKYLLSNLITKVNHELFRELNDYIFQGKSLNDIIQDYSTKVKNGIIKDEEEIKNGKALYKLIRHELQQIRKSENDLIQHIVEYLFEKSNKEIQELTDFLETEFKSTK